MTILRTITCDICGKTETEKTTNSGWMGWGAVQGINFNGEPTPNVCPEHIAQIADFMDKLRISYVVD